MTYNHLHYYDTNGCQFRVLKVGTAHAVAIQDFTPVLQNDIQTCAGTCCLHLRGWRDRVQVDTKVIGVR
jgi:hypothetical protein